ncbi:MAG TPA: AAA family ATPase [Epulopiscium sp.]|nr:AAA family ATPase [Candidatus Epulonipiscium sp.]
MNNYEQSKTEETLYLNNTLAFIETELAKDMYDIKDRRNNLIASRKEMWENGPKSADDFDRIPELNHYLAEVTYQTQNYERVSERIKKYTTMLNTPYFGRFDFKEDSYSDIEKFYIGLHNLMDMEDMSILVYDWRSPIASMYYQCEIGRGSYTSPSGILSGDLSLKRQYSIENGVLKYFFDSSIQIKDDILQQVLSKNTSPKMRHIVETIQKEQDLIIRDTNSQLLIVQGVAGSGKTSIALHRIAFLLYEGMDSKLFSNNIMIISPNSVFNQYISSVLPSLGEKNVEQTTLDDITSDLLGTHFTIEKRGQMLESLVRLHKHQDLSLKTQRIEFKGSLLFKHIIDRFIQYYIRRLLAFEDIYYNGQIIKTRHQLKNQLLSDKTSLPIARKLNRIENILIRNMDDLKNHRLGKIQKVVEENGTHAFDLETYSHTLAYKEIKVRKKQIRSFSKIDCFNLYKLLFQDSALFLRLGKSLELPSNINDIITETQKELRLGYISYEDCAGLLYLKLKLEGCDHFSSIRHLVIDEAQDYYPLQYEIFKLIFGHASFTVLGDFNQTLEKQGLESIYTDISSILNKKKSIKLSLNKGYRSSYEISLFSHKVIGHQNKDFSSFIRHGAQPTVFQAKSLNNLYKRMAKDIENYHKQGYESIAVICKTDHESIALQKNLEKYIKSPARPLVVPAYMAKGLEFDAVLVYSVSKNNYSSELDKKLLYIACTRALHELSLYYVGTKSTYLNFNI